MSLNKNTLLLSGALLAGAFDGNAQDYFPLMGVSSKNFYSAEAELMTTFPGSFSAGVIEGGIEGKPFHYQVGKIDYVGANGDITRYNSKTVASTDSILSLEEVVSEEITYCGPQKDRVLIVRKIFNAEKKREEVYIAGYNETDSVEFDFTKCMMPVAMDGGSDEKRVVLGYDNLIARIDKWISESGEAGLERAIAQLNKNAQAYLFHMEFIKDMPKYGQ